VPRELDHTNLKIIEGLGTYGLRNISQLAKELGMPVEMVRRRIKRMKSRKIMWLHASIYHTNLGLKKAVVVAEATPGYEKLLSNCLKANDFWTYITRCYGKFEGYLGIYTIPKDHILFPKIIAMTSRASLPNSKNWEYPKTPIFFGQHAFKV
jgi:hypothetical protein